MRHRRLLDSRDFVGEDEVATGTRVREIGSAAIVQARAVGVEERCRVAGGCVVAVPGKVEADVDSGGPGFAGACRVGGGDRNGRGQDGENP